MLIRIPENEFWTTDVEESGNPNVRLILTPSIESDLTIMTDQGTDMDEYCRAAERLSYALLTAASESLSDAAANGPDTVGAGAWRGYKLRYPFYSSAAGSQAAGICFIPALSSSSRHANQRQPRQS